MTDISVADDQEVDHSRRRFLTAATVATGAVGTGFAITPFLLSWLPSERARALGAPTEVDIAKIEPGQMVVTSWRKQAIYVVHRTPEMVATLPRNDSQLKDPTSSKSSQPEYAQNEMRSIKPDYLVLVGICTHLGCLPKQHFERGDKSLGADWPGGFFCPCHGSKFDMAGRVFEGSPASANLVVPPYEFRGDTLVIGVDGQKGVA
ncbi:MAG: ubiquinol-cytochrome c reductase iron-sulfur subunit [Steroidobacteraceae bacterium]